MFREMRRKKQILSEGECSPEQEQGCLKEIDRLMAQLCMIELDIEHMSGKEASELVRQKNAAVKQ